MDSSALIARLQEAVPEASLEAAPSVDLHVAVYASREHLPVVVRALREDPSLNFALLAELTAVDTWPHEPRFEVTYLLVSIANRLRLRLKVRVPGDDAHIATVSDVWRGANWLEREVWDLFGIVFDGHPDLRRLLMPEDWEGFPLRKDYPVQINQPVKTYEPLQVSQEQFVANIESTRDRARKD